MCVCVFRLFLFLFNFLLLVVSHLLDRQVLDSGKHVLVEYPVTLSSVTARDLYAQAADKGGCFPQSAAVVVNLV